MKLLFAFLAFQTTLAQGYDHFSTYCLEGKESSGINASITQTDQWSRAEYNGYDGTRGLKCLRSLSDFENIAYGALEDKYFSCALYNIKTKQFTPFKPIGPATTYTKNGYVEPNYESCIRAIRTKKH